jgi:small subunit ribosomal protein S14
MASKAKIVKSQRTPKYSSRLVRRCKLCGRARGYLRYFDMCRCCVRELANKGELNGFFKSSK